MPKLPCSLVGIVVAFSLVVACRGADDGVTAPDRGSAFTKGDLARLKDDKTPYAEREVLRGRLHAFVPTQPADMDLLFAAVECKSSTASTATVILERVQDPILLKRAYKYLVADGDHWEQAKVALRMVCKDDRATALPAVRKFAAQARVHPFPRVQGIAIDARQTLAEWGDPELLDELLDPRKQSDDRCPETVNADFQLLLAYGPEGRNRVMAMLEKEAPACPVYGRYIEAITDPQASPQLARLVRTSPRASLKVCAFRALARLDTTDAELVIREVFADPTLLGADNASQFRGDRYASVWARNQKRIPWLRQGLAAFAPPASPAAEVPTESSGVDVAALARKFRESSNTPDGVHLLSELCRLNTAVSQPVLLELMLDEARFGKLPPETQASVARALLAECERENADVVALILAELKKDNPAYPPVTAITLLTTCRGDRSLDAQAALLLVGRLTSDQPIGRAAAGTLQTLTGQYFQFAKPQDSKLGNSGEMFERYKRGEAPDNESLKESTLSFYEGEIPKKLQAWESIYKSKGKTPEEIKALLPMQEKALREHIAGLRERMKKQQERLPTWQVGIPIDQAEKWLRDYYKDVLAKANPP